MLTSLHIQEFKGLRDVNIPELRKVNLILGGQNVGKTSLLEAIIFVAGDAFDQNSPGGLGRLAETFRACEGHDAQRFWDRLIGTESAPTNVHVKAVINSHDYVMGGLKTTNETPVEWSLSIKGLGSTRLFHNTSNERYSIKSNGAEVPQPFPAFSKTAADQVTLYGRLVIGKKKRMVLQLLQNIDSRVDGIDAVAPDGEHRVYVDLVDGHVLPLSQLGHGFTRLFELYAGLAVTESKLALIDEIENGIHYSALPTLFQGVRELSESNGVQSIITTHSWECIRAAYKNFADAGSLKDFQLIRLERDSENNIRAVVINDEALDTVMEAGHEIR